MNLICFALTVGSTFDEKDHGPHLKDQDLGVLAKEVPGVLELNLQKALKIEPTVK